MCPEGVISAGDIEEVVNYMVPVLQRREGELTIQEYSSYCFILQNIFHDIFLGAKWFIGGWYLGIIFTI